MGLVETLLLAVALAMDCFTVSITCGIIQRRMGRQVWAMAFLFGFFQALMPYVGWEVAALFSRQISAYDHWVAFGLLAFLGGRMIRDGFRKEEKSHHFNPSRLSVLLTLSLATSIDALAVGFSFVGMGVRGLPEVLAPVLVIGIVSFLFSLFGKYIGVKLGRKFHWPAEQLGGAILLAIGFKVLLQHIAV